MRRVPAGDCHLRLPRHHVLCRAAWGLLLSAFARSAAPLGGCLHSSRAAAEVAAGSNPGDIFPCLCPFSRGHAAACSPPPPPPLQPSSSFSAHFSSLPQSFFCLRPSLAWHANVIICSLFLHAGRQWDCSIVAFQPHSEPLRAPSPPQLAPHPSCGTLPGPAPPPPCGRAGRVPCAACTSRPTATPAPPSAGLFYPAAKGN